MAENGVVLQVRQLQTGYGKRQVLFGLSLEVLQGEIVALIGPNGAGKSTVLKAVCGMLPVWEGEICFNGALTNGSSPACNVARGMALCLQGNRVFAGLTVRENLQLGGFHLSPKVLDDRIEAVSRGFPLLRERFGQDACTLSGGEQQMLTLARALVSRPKLLMLDEPSLGLAPNLVRAVLAQVHHIALETDTAVLIVEQKVREVLAICHRVYSLKLGKVAFCGRPGDLQENKEKLRNLFL